MQPWKVAVLSILCLSVTLTVFAEQQKPPEKPKVPTIQQHDAIEKAHEGIFANAEDKASEASRLTEAVAGSLSRLFRRGRDSPEELRR